MKNFISISVTFMLLFFSCSNDDDQNSKEFDGSDEAIENFFSAEVLMTMNDLGFVVNEGATPPNVTGEYLVSIIELVASNISNDVIGKTYSDEIVKFSGQNNQNLTIDFEAEQGGAIRVGTQSFISGGNDKFTVFIRVESTKNNHTSILALAYSGTLVENGVKDLQQTLIMLDDNEDPEGNLIENGQGRLFKDSDGVSPKQ